MYLGFRTVRPLAAVLFAFVCFVFAAYSSSAATTFPLTIVNGSGSGSYASGTKVAITANAAPKGEIFVNWTGATVMNSKVASTTIVMPSKATTVTANFATAYTLTVKSGSGSGTYYAGKNVAIKANAAPTGEVFNDWTGGTVAAATSASTTLTMPAKNTTVTATYKAKPTTFALTVHSGSGSGSYAAGTVVTISANAAPSGEVFSDWTGATVAGSTSATTTLTMPAANASVTANYVISTASNFTLTVVNGSGSGSYPAGSTVTITANAPPSGKAFLDWNELPTSWPTSPTTTLIMPSYSASVQANYLPITNATIPYPVTTHPRLWITQADLARLQSWATPSNPVYENGMAPLLQQAVSVYNTQFFPNGQPNVNYPDPGDVQGYDTYVTEQYALVLAFNSLIDPSAANRITYAQDARNLLMHAMNQAVLGNLPGAGWRDPLFATYNRANGSGEQWPLIVDWLYDAKDADNNDILTPSDKATIDKVFSLWANNCLNAYTDYNDRPTPEGVTNSTQLLPNNLPYRMASNNYYLGHARLMTMMALCMDPSDDPPVNPSLPPAQLGNTLRSYILDANGAWLYQEYAMMGDGSTVASSYGIPGGGAGFGVASGGLPPEGMLYGHSFGFILGQLLALQTAGFNSPSLSGPQIGLIGAPVWKRYVTGYLSSLTPTPFVPASETYLGPVYQFGSYGDLLRLYVTPDTEPSFVLLTLLEQENGDASQANAAQWLVDDANTGGSAAFYSRMVNPFSWSSTNAILTYMLYPPGSAAPTDPRSTYPTVFYDPPAGRIVAHSSWSSNNTMFDYRASWITIYHQNGDGGQFEFYRNGDWLTKEMSNYDNNEEGLTTEYHNTLALKNWCAQGTPNLQFYETNIWANGSQWMEGLNAGDPTTLESSGANYVYASSDLTNLYNRPDKWTPSDNTVDITQATRSIVWLNNDYIVVYDRATTNHTGLFKRFNLGLVTNPVVSGHTATETLADGQQLFIQALLPSNIAFSSFNGATTLNPIAELEPTAFILTDQDPSNPANTRFLHVLQGANSGVAKTPAAYTQSTAGTSFDGAVFGTEGVFFPVNVGTFSGTTLSLPVTVTNLLVAGLAPNTSYTVAMAPGGAGNVVTITPGGSTATTDSAGLLELAL